MAILVSNAFVSDIVSLERYDIDLDSQFDDVLGRYPRKPWSKFITSENQRYISNEAIDFLDKLLRYDHQERLTAEESQQHPYFGTLIPLCNMCTTDLGRTCTSRSEVRRESIIDYTRNGRYMERDERAVWAYRELKSAFREAWRL